MGTKNIHSHHIFLCPFRIGSDFEYNKIGEGTTGGWENFNFEIKNGADYSERVYFYDFVYKAIFNDCKKNSTKFPLKQYFYEPIDIKKNAKKPYYFTVNRSYKEGENGKQVDEFFSLQIDNITLNIYETGIGVIAYHLNNRNYLGIECIKKINDIGRRIFPQFMVGESPNIIFLKNKFIPSKIIISKSFIEKETDIPKDLTFPSVCSDYSKIEKNISSGSGFAKDFDESRLLPCYITSYIKQFSKKMKISPLIDDRMFVICWIGNKSVVDNIYSSTYENEGGEPIIFDADWKDSEDWHNLLFCDFEKNSNHASTTKRNELNELHTNNRWEDWKTLFGITKYSFIVLTDGNQNIDFIRQHTMTIYFQMVQLCLVQRASILKFSKDAADLAGEIRTTIGVNDQKKLNELQISYVRFMNRLYFREITAQDQGIDLYNKLQKQMRIPEQLKELDAEINEMMQLQNMLKSQEESKLLQQLTIIATIFLIPSLLAGLLGMNIVDMDSFTTNGIGTLIFGALAFVTFLISAYALSQIFGTVNKEKLVNRLQLNLIMFILFTILVLSTVGILIKQLS